MSLFARYVAAAESDYRASVLSVAIGMPALILGVRHPLPSLDDAWDGIMLEYTEQDFPTSEPYRRTIPGWQCRVCGQKVGTSREPPRHCPKCDCEWAKAAPSPRAAGGG